MSKSKKPARPITGGRFTRDKATGAIEAETGQKSQAAPPEAAEAEAPAAAKSTGKTKGS